ncbi:MAG: hypothetical protein CBE21_00330, partial [Proteobacteria bacterium TMED261]
GTRSQTCKRTNTAVLSYLCALYNRIWSQNCAPIAEGSKILGELEIGGLFERKGHEFVDADINLFDADDKTCYSKVRLRAI